MALSPVPTRTATKIERFTHLPEKVRAKDSFRLAILVSCHD